MVLPWVKKHEEIALEVSSPVNYIKRDIIRSLDRYSLMSILQCCNYLCTHDKLHAKWLVYLIIKWKFIAMDAKRSSTQGKECNIKTIEAWCNALWQSSCHMPSAFHFMRRLVDVQSSWQRGLIGKAMFFPAFIKELKEDDPVRLSVITTYGMEPKELGLLITLLYSFRKDGKAVLYIAKLHSQNMHNQLIRIIENLTTNYKDICSTGLDLNTGYRSGLIKYLASINIQETSNESMEVPWVERYPILELESTTVFMVDEHMWHRRITTYLYERLTEDSQNTKLNIGHSFEGYCKDLISPFFTEFNVITELPRNRRNADLVTEDEDHIYIFEIKHKKYDSKLFSKETKKELTLQLENQIVHGYHQIKSTSDNIDNKRNIFKSHKKNINKKRIGFVVTERSYMIGRGSNFSEFFDECEKETNTSIHDKDIYFVGIEELELLLLTCQEKNIQLGKLVEIGYSDHGFELNLGKYENYNQIKSKTNSQKMMDCAIACLYSLKDKAEQGFLNSQNVNSQD